MKPIILTCWILFSYLVFFFSLELLKPGANVVCAGETSKEHKSCISIRVSNCFGRTIRIAHGPVNLCAEVRVQPLNEHRGLEVVWDYAPRISITDDENGSPDDPFREIESQDGSLGSSTRSLNGAEERLRHDVKMSHLSGGTYEVKARVFTDTEHKTVCGFAYTRVQVR